MKIQNFFEFQEVSSTSSVLAAWLESSLAETGAGEQAETDAFCLKNLPALVLTEGQTEGKGRDGKRWASPLGCLMFSLAFSQETIRLPMKKTPLVGLAAGLAVRDTVLATMPACERVGRLGIHWPNDVCLMVPDEKKLCGILVERLASGVFVMGIGLNVHNSCREAPPEIRQRLFSLSDIAERVGESEAAYIALLSRREILGSLLEKLATRFQQLSRDSAEMVAEIEKYCVQCGTHTTLRTPRGEIHGFCTGLAPNGCIILDGKAYSTGEF